MNIVQAHKSISEDEFIDTRWLQYFDPWKATEAVFNHVARLSSYRTPEQHTLKSYQQKLEYFGKFTGVRFPDKALLLEFISHLRNDRNFAHRTILTYLAPIKHFLHNLYDQTSKGWVGSERMEREDYREELRLAMELKHPKNDITTNHSPLWRNDFVRLTRYKLDKVLHSIDRTTIAGKRDYALLYVGFSTGLRVGELQRITLNKIFVDELAEVVLIKVRGKRNNFDPVPIDLDVYEAILAYVDSFNAPLSQDDPRRITADTPIWQPMHSATRHMNTWSKPKDDKPSRELYKPEKGLSVKGIYNIVRRKVCNILNLKRFSPHDMRRTITALLYTKGAKIHEIQRLVRHKSFATTATYIGSPPNYRDYTATTYVEFGVKPQQMPLF